MLKLIDSVKDGSYSSDKKTRGFSEDSSVITPYFVAVIDGATGKANRRLLDSHNSDAEWFSATFANNLEQAALKREERKTDDIKEIFEAAAKETIRNFNTERLANHNVGKFELPCAAMIAVMQHFSDPSKITLVNIEDGCIIYKDGVIQGSPTLKEIERQREARLKNNLAKGIHLTRDAFVKQMRKDQALRNSPNGYPAVDLTTDWIEHHEVKYIETKLNAGDKIILSTDGLTRLFEVYNLMDSQMFYDKAITQGLDVLLKELRSAETVEDWDRIKYPRLKATDDVCALIVEID